MRLYYMQCSVESTKCLTQRDKSDTLFKEESLFVDFTDARKKGFPTAPIKTYFRKHESKPWIFEMWTTENKEIEKINTFLRFLGAGGQDNISGILAALAVGGLLALLPLVASLKNPSL
nr:hypothetical protein CFP56_53006 [Quercus suber]